MFDLKTAKPVSEKNDGSLEPDENIVLATAKPVIEGEIPYDENFTLTMAKSPIDEKRPSVAPIDTFYNMPVLGGFSAKQFERGATAVQTTFSSDRSKAFKWFALGMPDDIEGINKAETMTWADLGNESPFIKDVQNAIKSGIGKGWFAPIGIVPPIGKRTEEQQQQFEIAKDTFVNFPVEVAGDMLEFFTDPAMLLVAGVIGAGFKKLPSALMRIRTVNPALYDLLMWEVGKNKPALQKAYKTLGLKPKSSRTQVNKRYRKISTKNHPDRGGNVDTYNQAQEAYNTIVKYTDGVYKQIMSAYNKVGGTRGAIEKLPTPKGKGKPLTPKTPPAPPTAPKKGIVVPKGEGEKVVSSIIEINGKQFEAPLHSQAINMAKDAGVLFENSRGDWVDKNGKPVIWDTDLFKTSTGRIIDRFTADRLFNVTAGENIARSKIIPTPQPTKAPEGVKEKAPVVKGKERGFIKSVKGEIPALKVAGQYIPRPTDPLAIKARNQIKDDLVTAQKMALTGTDDASIAVGSELLKKYSQDAETQKDETIKDAIYEKAAELAVSMASRLTELGRSVQAAAILSRLTPEGQVRFAAKTIQKYNEKIEETKGGLLGLKKKIPELTPEQTKEILTRMKDISAMPEGEQKAIMVRELQDHITDLIPTPLFEKIITVWKAGLLTGLKTSGLNIFSNIAHMGSELAKDIPATLVDMIVSVGTGERSVAFTATGLLKGTKEGANKGWRFMKTGFDERNVLSKYDYKRVNMGSSKFAKGLQKYEEFVFRLLGTEDQPFYYGAKMRSLYEQAKVAAINKKLKGDEAKAFIDNLVMNPTEEIALLSIEDAKIAVYQNETALGKLAKDFQRLGPAAHIILPFGRTPSAVATQILNYTPVGGIKTVINNIGKDRFDQREFSKGIGRAITGTAVLGLGAYLYKKGMVSLDYPKTEAERKLWELEGKKANSIKIGGKWRTVQSFGPLGNVLLVGGHFMRGYENTGSIAGAFIQGSPGAFKSFTEQTFLQSVKRAIDAYEDPKRNAISFVNSLAASIVPTIVKDVAVALDPKKRRSEGIIQRIMSRLPILRQMLEPRLDVFGEEMERGINFIESMADPTRPSPIGSDPIVAEIRRLVDAEYPIKTTQLGARGGYKSLTTVENTAMWREAGQVAYSRITEFVNTEGYEEIPDDLKAKRINKFISDAQNNARINIAIAKTAGLKGAELRTTLEKIVEDGLLTQALYRKYLGIR